jgi:hypothetical protein
MRGKSSRCGRCAHVSVENWVRHVSTLLQAGVSSRPRVLTVPELRRKTFSPQAQAVLRPCRRGGARCREAVCSRGSGRALPGGSLVVLQTPGRHGQSHPPLHLIAPRRERVAWDTVAVSPGIGRLVPQVLPKGFQRLRAYGVQAPKTVATLTGRLRQEAWAQLRGRVTGAITRIAPLTSRQRSQQRTGQDPVRCPHCQSTLDGWRLWPPPYGVLPEAVDARRRGK